jgi:PAS domain S-box-containing protein
VARLAQLYRDGKKFRRAIDCCRRLMHLDPYNETALRMSMELLVHAGRGLEALLNYQEFSNLLQRELGVEPEPETQELYLKIAEGRLIHSGPSNAELAPSLSLVDAFRSLDGFVIWDQADRFVLCNDKFREIFAPAADLLKPGVAWEDIMELCISKGRFPEAAANPEEYLRRRTERRRLGTTEAPDTVLDDGRCYRLAHRRTENGALIVIFTDATDRKHRERALERSHARLKAVLSASPLPLEELDLDGKVVFCNQAFLRLLGYDISDVLGQHQARLMPSPWIEQIRRGESDADDRARTIRTQYRNKAGRLLWVTVHWSPVRDDAGKTSGFIGFLEPDRA